MLEGYLQCFINSIYLPCINQSINIIPMKTILRSFFALFAILSIFASCQKELSVEKSKNSGSGTGTSVYTFAGATGDCTAPVINSTYTVNTPATAANTVELQVTVAKIGTYTISTATINGLTFSASGTFISTGVQTIIFTAVGTPVIKGAFPYSPGFNGCSFSITVLPVGTFNTAVFTYPLAPNACNPFDVSGTYMVGVSLTSANTVKISVIVTTVGNYSISTITTNGISFAASGSFTALGNQTLTLTGSGKPLAVGSFNYTPSNNGCSFTIPVVAAAPPATFTFPSAPNTCAPVTVKGTYVVGTALASTNTVSIQVNVATIGSYSISTAVSNGFSFTAAGNFAATGLQTIIFTGSGTPVAAGNFNFTPGTNGCSFLIAVTAGAGPAVFSLQSSGGTCSNVIVDGIYVVGQALTASNVITVVAEVTTAGTFNISTTTANGITFGGAGNFAVAGTYNLHLSSQGTPIAAGTNSFTFPIAIGGCSFNVTTTLPGPIAPGILTCKMDGVFTDFSTDGVAELSFNLYGTTETFLSITGRILPSGTPSDVFNVFVTKKDGGNIAATSYTENTFVTSLTNLAAQLVLDVNATGLHWSSISNSPFFPGINPPLLITITSITSTRCIGTFKGTLQENFGQNAGRKVITEGIFNVPFK